MFAQHVYEQNYLPLLRQELAAARQKGKTENFALVCTQLAQPLLRQELAAVRQKGKTENFALVCTQLAQPLLRQELAATLRKGEHKLITTNKNIHNGKHRLEKPCIRLHTH
ncbi:MAG: hypothetical protein IJZ92_04010 [Bacteroidaceae bacterium]|nr:hypothetical protein [Bacteroidaceae bacterium]